MIYRNLIYAATCLVFTTIAGAGIYEHVAVWPNAFAAPPQSLTMFQGNYPLHSAPFWMTIHPVTILFLTATLILNWKTARRKWILIPMVVYLLVLAITFSYFVPELMSITGTSYSTEVSADLQERGSQWITLSLVRMLVLLVAMLTLNFGMTRSGEKQIR